MPKRRGLRKARTRGRKKKKGKKKEQCAPKAGAKATPNSTTPSVSEVCPFSASSISSLHLRDRGHSRVPRIQTNSSGSYRQSNKCRTFTFSSEGSATLRGPAPTHPPPSSSTSPALFSTMFLFLSFTNPIRIFLLARAPAHGSFASGNEATRVRDLYYVQLSYTSRS